MKPYADYYKGRENFYHNYNHAKYVTELGLKILENNPTDGYQSLCEKIFVHAMMCHDAGHNNGLENSDFENIEVALHLSKRHFLKNNENQILNKEWVELIIKTTEFPHKPISDILPSRYTRQKDLIYLMQIARDVDTLGIISIENQDLREKSLVGFLRELSAKQDKEELRKSFTEMTIKFFEHVKFNTNFGRDWAKNNLAEMKSWQLGYINKAIEIVFQKNN